MVLVETVVFKGQKQNETVVDLIYGILISCFLVMQKQMFSFAPQQSHQAALWFWPQAPRQFWLHALCMFIWIHP